VRGGAKSWRGAASTVAYSKGDFTEMLGNTPFRRYEFTEESIGPELWLQKS